MFMTLRVFNMSQYNACRLLPGSSVIYNFDQVSLHAFDRQIGIKNTLGTMLCTLKVCKPHSGSDCRTGSQSHGPNVDYYYGLPGGPGAGQNYYVSCNLKKGLAAARMFRCTGT